MSDQEKFGECVMDLMKVMHKYEYPEIKSALLSCVTMTYCMAECIPDAIKDFREDIPKMEHAIRTVFGSVDQMSSKGREEMEKRNAEAKAR